MRPASAHPDRSPARLSFLSNKGSECPLQVRDRCSTHRGSASSSRSSAEAKTLFPIYSDLIMLDQDRIHPGAGAPIRYLEQWKARPGFGLFEGSSDAVIDTFPGQQVDAKTSGNIYQRVPVGALTNHVLPLPLPAVEAQETRPPSAPFAPSAATCRAGPSACGGPRRISDPRNMAVNDEWTCGRGRFLHQYVDHPSDSKRRWCREGQGFRPATGTRRCGRIVEALSANPGVDACGPARDRRHRLAGQQRGSLYLFRKFFGRWTAPTTLTPALFGRAGAAHRAVQHHGHHQRRPDNALPFVSVRARPRRCWICASTGMRARQRQTADRPDRPAAHRTCEVPRTYLPVLFRQ